MTEKIRLTEVVGGLAVMVAVAAIALAGIVAVQNFEERLNIIEIRLGLKP